MTGKKLDQPGLMLSSELPPNELTKLARLSEELGYGQLWYTDQRFWRDSYIGLSQIAAVTSEIKIGPGVNDPFTRHPALIAMAIATLDELSGGRAQLGLGVGGSGIAQMRLPKERPVRALREAIELIRQMVTGDTVTYEGEIFQLHGASLGFEPVRTHIPIHVATHGPQVLKLSSKIADGVLLGNMGQREAVSWASGIVRDGERHAGRKHGSVTVDLRLEAIISEDSEQSISVIRKRLAHRLVVSYPKWDFLGDRREQMDPAIGEAAITGDATAVENLLTDADIRASALVGSPEEAAQQLSSILTSDVANVTIRPYDAPGFSQEHTVRMFAEQVWPAVLSAAIS